MNSINNCNFFARILASSTLLLAAGNAVADHERVGDVLQVLIPAISYGATFYLDDAQGRSQFHKSFITTASVTQVLKHLVKKKASQRWRQVIPIRTHFLRISGGFICTPEIRT